VSEITPSIVHGSSIWPASYVVNMADLKVVMLGNRIKFADDTYVVMPTANANSRQVELDSVEEWSWTNNVKVNPVKYAEVIFTDKRRKTVERPPEPVPNIKRVSSMKILGVTFTSGLSVSVHIQTIVCSCAQTLYAPRAIRAHSMDDRGLQTIYHSVIVVKG